MRTGLGEAGVEGGAELKLNAGDMAGDKWAEATGKHVDETGEILVEKSILSSRDRERSRALMLSNVGSMLKLCACLKACTV